MNWLAKLKGLNPCSDALEWAEQFPTLQAAWDACERGDYMLWFAALVGLTPERHKLLVVATCRIAERWLYLIPANEPAPRIAIETALRWTEGLATLAEVQRAAARAARAAWAAESAAEAAVWTAGAATRAAEAAWAAAWAAESAAEAAADSTEAAAWAAARAAWAAESKSQADIVRQYLTCPDWEDSG